MATPFSVTLWSTTSTNPAPLCIVHWRTARPWRPRKVGELSAWVAVRMGRPRNRIVLDQCCWPRSSPLPGHEGSSESTTVGKHERAVPFVGALRFRVASRQADARRGGGSARRLARARSFPHEVNAPTAATSTRPHAQAASVWRGTWESRPSEGRYSRFLFPVLVFSVISC